MKRIAFLLMLLPFSLLAQKQIINDANAEPRSVSGSFHAIKLSYAFDCYLSQDEEEAVVVSAASPELIGQITTTVSDGVLIIGFKEAGKWWKNKDKKLKVYISFRQLDKISASGACDVFVNGELKANDLLLDMSGASDFKGKINARELTVNLSGASDVEVTGGKVTNLKIDASGASDFKGYNLIADNCSAVASGASDIKVTVNNELNASASGASGIYYKGEGRIRDLKSNGASSVSRKG